MPTAVSAFAVLAPIHINNDKLTVSYAHAQLIGGGCFAIALVGCAPAPPIKAIELTAPQSE